MVGLLELAAAPPLAPPGAADAPTLDLYVGDERRTTITTNFGTATEALAAAVLRAGDPGDAVEGRVVPRNSRKIEAWTRAAIFPCEDSSPTQPATRMVVGTGKKGRNEHAHLALPITDTEIHKSGIVR